MQLSLTKMSTPASTQARRYSLREYFWVITFRHDVHTERPFSMFNLNGRKTDDFPHYLVIGPLTEKGRLQKFQFTQKSSVLHSIFCKVEKG